MRLALATLFLATAFAVPAQADHRRDALEHERRELHALAQKLERATNRLLDRTHQRAHHGDRRQLQALRAAQALEARADRFRQSVHRRPFAPQSREDLREVRHAYRVAESQIHDLRGRRLDGDLVRVGHLIDEIEEVYHPRARHRGPLRHHGRRDRHVRHADPEPRVVVKLPFPPLPFPWSWSR